MIFPDPLVPDETDLVFVGADFSEATVTEAYRRGLFPWRGGPNIPWYCPSTRAVIRPEALVVHRSLRKRAANGGFTVAFDHDFRGTMERCATTPRRHESSTWIGDDVIEGYTELHARGVAHSVEVYREGEPVGGLYGLSFGRLFHGESMYFRERDASKLALWSLSAALSDRGYVLIDCQVPTGHVLTMGAEPWSRARYLQFLESHAQVPSTFGSWRDWRVGVLALGP